jgi:hypothetical protein
MRVNGSASWSWCENWGWDDEHRIRADDAEYLAARTGGVGHLPDREGLDGPSAYQAGVEAHTDPGAGAGECAQGVVMSFPYVTRKQRKIVHASRMASKFAKDAAKRIECALKMKKERA